MKLVIFAHPCEAKSLLAQLRPKELSPSLYRYEEGLIVISGVGLLPAMAAVAKYHTSCEEIYNLGFAGALQERMQIKELFSITQIGRVQNFPSATELFLPPGDLPSARLVTADTPLHDAHLKKELSHRHDLVDMEGYGIVFLAKQLHKKCTLWKIVSDFSLPGSSPQIRDHQEELSSLLARAFLTPARFLNQSASFAKSRRESG